MLSRILLLIVFLQAGSEVLRLDQQERHRRSTPCANSR